LIVLFASFAPGPRLPPIPCILESSLASPKVLNHFWRSPDTGLWEYLSNSPPLPAHRGASFDWYSCVSQADSPPSEIFFPPPLQIGVLYQEISLVEGDVDSDVLLPTLFPLFLTLLTLFWITVKRSTPRSYNLLLTSFPSFPGGSTAACPPLFL